MAVVIDYIYIKVLKYINYYKGVRSYMDLKIFTKNIEKIIKSIYNFKAGE